MNVGSCRDTLSVGYITSDSKDVDMMEIRGTQTYVSPEGGILVRLSTCYRYTQTMWDAMNVKNVSVEDLKLEVTVQFTGPLSSVIYIFCYCFTCR